MFSPETPFKCNGGIQNYGLGYFLPEKQSKRFRFEIYGDIVLGKYEIIKYPNYGYYNITPTAYLNGQYTKIGFLTNLGYISRNKMFQYGCSARFSNIDFYNPSYIEKDRLYSETKRLNTKKDYYLLEAGLYGKIGRKAVKGQLELVFYNGINASDDNVVQNFNFSLMLGLVVNLNVFSKSKK